MLGRVTRGQKSLRWGVVLIGKAGRALVCPLPLKSSARGPESSLGPRNGVRQIMCAHSRLQVEVLPEGI